MRESCRGIPTTPDLFIVLAVRPELGRFFLPADEKKGAAPAVVISDNLWRRVFDASRTVIGMHVRLDGRVAIVVGVAPPGLKQPAHGSDLVKTDYWSAWQRNGESDDRGIPDVQGIARLRNGITLAAAQADLRMIQARLATRYSKSDGRFGVLVRPLADAVVGDVRPFLLAIFAAVAAVLLVACANVANMLLSRGATRDRELAIRAANGASRMRIVAQLFVETLIFAVLGGLGGLVLCAVGIHTFIGTQPDLPRVDTIAFAPVTALYVLGIVGFCTLAAGLAPALTLSQREVADALKAAGRGGDANRGSRVRAGLVIAEIALTLALVVASALVVRSFVTLTHQALGFSSKDVLVSDTIHLPDTGSAMNPAASPATGAFYDRLLPRIRAIPGVRLASPAATVPFMESEYHTGFSIVGQAHSGQTKSDSWLNLAGPQFFGLLGIALIEGRAFTARDRLGTSDVALVNEAFVRRYLSGKRTLGMRIVPTIALGATHKTPPERTIVGVVGDVRETYDQAPSPMIYLPYAQTPMDPAILVVKAAPGARIAGAVAAAIPAADRLLPAPTVRDLDSYMNDDAARARLGAVTLGALGVVAFVLAIAGIYAVVSYGVAQRTHELGVRMALGARAPQIVQRVVGGTLGLTIIGVLCGVVVGAFTVRLVADQLYGVKPYDALTFGIVILAMTFASIAAALIPARRATRVDPIVALRYE
jgi:putative ABC transport system permease protein